MVWTNPQTLAFWTDAAQMGITQRTLGQLQVEGFGDVDSLHELTDEGVMKQTLQNCKYPPHIQNPAAGAAMGDMIPQGPFVIGSRSLGRIRAACDAVEYHRLVGRSTSAQSMMWTRLENFKEQMAAMKVEIDSEDKLKLPLITKYLPIVPFLEAFDIYLDQVYGVRNCPLGYVTRPVALVPAAAPPLAPNQLYSDEHGSLKAEMIARVSHTHALYRLDNAKLFEMIEKATRGTKYAATIAPFKRAKDGRGAYMALRAQHAGSAHWDSTQKIDLDFIMGTKFTGGGQMTLEDYLSRFRQHFVSIQLCAQHVTVAVPTPHSLVGYLLDNIECSDADVKAALAAIKLDDGVDGMRNDFERAAAFLLPVDPVAKKSKMKKKRGIAQLSSTVADDDSKKRKKVSWKKGKPTWKKARGKTGVELRYYKPSEWRKLTQGQMAELKTLRQEADGKKDNVRASVAAVIQEMEAEKTAKADKLEEVKSLIASLQAPAGTSPYKAGAKVSSAASILKNKGKQEAVMTASECAEVAATKLMSLIDLDGDKKKSGGR